jgi:hypothetical protein
MKVSLQIFVGALIMQVLFINYPFIAFDAKCEMMIESVF